MGISSAMGTDALLPGLVLVKSQTVGTAVSSVTVSDVFNATYDSYRIVVSGIVASTSSPNLWFSLSEITGSVYYTSGTYLTWANTTINAYSPAVSTYCLVGTVGTENIGMTIDIHSPFLTREKYGWAQSADVSYALSVGLRIDSTVSATGFVFTPASGTLTGGTIRVYGYRN